MARERQPVGKLPFDEQRRAPSRPRSVRNGSKAAIGPRPPTRHWRSRLASGPSEWVESGPSGLRQKTVRG
jgi:hypothetical protein